MATSALVGNVPFLWEGTDRKGNKIKGKSMASDVAHVRAELRRQGVVPSKIKKQGRGLKRGGTITTADIAIFSRQLATMLAAGIPLFNCNAMQISDQAEIEGVIDLRRAGLNKVKEGVTSLEEINRVTIE